MDNQLEKKYGLPTAVCMVVGIVIGSGVFFKAETVLNKTGGNMPLGILAWGIVGAIMIICSYVFATMATRYEKVNGLVDYAEATKGSICHWFTVDDLNHLKRGGRISAATALVGTMLSIKPVLHVDDEGRLISVSKARGRKASLMALVDRMEATALDAANGTVFISHGDCLADAEYVAKRVREKFGVKNIYINFVGPVIGAHSGPGTVALFYYGVR